VVEVAWKQRLDGIRINSLADLFGVDKPVIGMVHLWPLPGAPGTPAMASALSSTTPGVTPRHCWQAA